MSKSINLELPWPPSVNDYWHENKNKKFKGKHLTARAMNFRQDAVVLTRMQLGRFGNYRQLDAFLSCKMLYVPPRNVGDIDNYSKGIFDSLEHSKVVYNDNQIKHLEIFWHKARKPGFVRIFLEPVTWPFDEDFEKAHFVDGPFRNDRL